MSTALVELGRHGDILNILPLVNHLSKSTEVKLIVHKDFQDVPENIEHICKYLVSPVEAVNDVRGTRDWLASRYNHDIIISKVDGNPDSVRVCRNFCEEAYRLAGFRELYGHLEYPTINYDKLRGAELLNKYIKKDHINVLYNLEGHSSVFPYKSGLSAMFTNLNFIRNLNMIDIGAIKCTNICDLLALYDVADLLITVDTATLHLSKYSNIKTINFVNDNPWYASDPSKNSVLTLTYSKVPENVHLIFKEIYSLCLI